MPAASAVLVRPSMTASKVDCCFCLTFLRGASCADNNLRNAAEEALKQSFTADPATHLV